MTATTIVPDLVWESLTGYNGPGRHHPITFANETHGFVLSGGVIGNPATVDFYMYSEADDMWTDITSSSAFPGPARSFGYGVVLNEAHHPKAYLGFGATDNTRLADWWEFDMSTHLWQELAEFPGPGRRHPAVVPIRKNSDGWEIHVGLGDCMVEGARSNLNDWWKYDIDTDTWSRLPDFPSSRRHHPFYFGLGDTSYVGLGHSHGYIERDWYSYNGGTWNNETDFASYEAIYDEDFSSVSYSQEPVTTEARVAGTQFSIDLPLVVASSSSDTTINSSRSSSSSSSSQLMGALGFVLSGDGDDHSTMEEGEFHAFYPSDNSFLAGPTTTGGGSAAAWWRRLPPHPGRSRWAPGSFVMRGSARAYFTGGYDRENGLLFADLWRIDLSRLFLQRAISSSSSLIRNNNNNIFLHLRHPFPTRRLQMRHRALRKQQY